ncbi:hypothetical protein CVT25_006752 [Psilocybe cyanescens]|uniref:AMP-dependent synthetase/ligase domain-containing protein n=1 Tax=Psilocybe cyanescens TaxID=93625 RepID=A0A409X7H8_PSICY|nr:hypothetical protein CVT25_006752 [Psilocybe cyanescens]
MYFSLFNIDDILSVYQFEVTKPSIIIADAENVSVAAQAAAHHHIPKNRIIVLGGDITSKTAAPYQSVNMLIEQGRYLPPIDAYSLKPGAGASKVAFLCFSSGTTGKPKMTLVITRKFDFLKFLKGIKKYRITHLMYAGRSSLILSSLTQDTGLFLLKQYYSHPAAQTADLSSVRYCMIAAAPVTVELTQQLIKKLPNARLGQGYGMTEMCGAVSMWPLSQKIGTVGSGGRLISGTTAKVVKSDGTIAGTGEPGELWVKGNQITLGYYKNEASYDGWYRTGDEVKIDVNGDLFVIDRIKEMIKVKGFQVAPAELEGHLIDHPSVAEVGVIGVPDEYAGELPLAFIVLRQPVADEIRGNPAAVSSLKAEISKFVMDAKSRYKWLDGGIEFVDSIPKNPSGKILRRLLRDRVVRKAGVPKQKL